MAVNHITGTNGTHGTNSASPTAGGNGGPAVYNPAATIGADSTNVEVDGGNGGDGGNGTGVPGAAGGNGGNATATVNGSIYNAPATTTLQVSVTAIGGNGGNAGTGTGVGAPGGKGGNASVTMNGNIVQTSKAMSSIEFDAIAIAGAPGSGGTLGQYGNASATLNGNIFQPSKSATTVTLRAAAYTPGTDPYSHDGVANYGVKTATLNGNIVQGNINNVYLYADTYNPATPFIGANGTATISGNVIQTNASNTGFVSLEASGQHIDIEKNKIQLGNQELDLSINEFSPSYDAKIKGNEFTGSGTNTFVFSDTAYPGPRTTPDTINIDLTAQTFTFNGDNNKLKNFQNVTVNGDNAATITGDGMANTLTGGTGDDIINGMGGNDIIVGSGGNDLLTGGAGDDNIDGGAGMFDTAVYSGNRSQYTLNFGPGLPPRTGNLAGTVTDNVAGRDGTDTLKRVEYLQFADGLYDVVNDTFHPTVPVNNPPVAVNDAYTIAEDNVLTVPATGVLANDTDAENDPLTASIVANAAHGTVVLNANGSFTYTPNANYNGTDSFTYQANDGTSNSNTATVNLTITSVNDAPAGTDKTITSNEDTTYALTKADFGFTDPLDAPYASGANNFANVIITQLPTNGSLTYGAGNTPVTLNQVISAADIQAGLLKFTPALNANGNGYDSFKFEVQDDGATGGQNQNTDQTPNTITFNITPVNDAPVANPDTYAPTQDQVFSINATGGVLANDTDVDTAHNLLTATLVADAAHGHVALNSDGSFTYTPNAGFNGADSFTYKASDGTDFSNIATVTLNVAPVTNFHGTPGPDNLMGTNGDDTFYASAGNDTYNALGGNDTLVFESSTGPITIDISNPNPQVIGGGYGTDTFLNFENVDTSLTSSNNTITGNSSDNVLKGGSGDDTFFATTGHDTIDGGGNTAVGDTVNFANFAGGVTIDLNSGAAQSLGGGNTITLSNIENLTGGAGNDTFIDKAGANNKYVSGGGVDTVNFGTAMSATTIAYAGGHFTVTGANGTDTTDVAILQGSSGPRTLLVGSPGGFATIQAAIAAAQDGDTILIAPGTYSGNVTVNKQLTIMGAGPGVVLEGTFAQDNGIPAGMTVADWLKTQPNPPGYTGTTGITVTHDGVTLSNLTVENYLTAVAVGGASVDSLTMDGVTTQHAVLGFSKPDDTALSNLNINHGAFNDEYMGVTMFNDTGATGGAGFGKDATNTTIQNSSFQDIDQKGIYMETAMGNTALEGLTMNNVGQYGGVPTWGADGLHGNAIDLNLKYHDYSQSVIDIGGFNLTNVGSSAGQNGAIVVEARTDGGYAALPAITDDGVHQTQVTIHDGTIDGTTTGIRAGENVANPANNDAGPAVSIDGVTITNASVAEIDNHTNSLMTVVGTSGDDTYTSAQTAGSTGQLALFGMAGNDYLLGGLGDDRLQGGTGDDMLDGGAGVNLADYSDATQNGLIVNLLTGLSSGGGLGNDTLQNISNVTGSIYNDTLIGDDNNNLLNGDDGNDKLYGHGGNNTLVGGIGTDVAYYIGLETDYAAPNTGMVSGGADNVSDNLISIERLKFLSPSHVSDVNNDGHSDVIFQNNTDGSLAITDGATNNGTLNPAVIGSNNWSAVGTGQFDPDNSRQAGVLLQNNMTGNLEVLTDIGGTNTLSTFSTQPGAAAWKAVAIGDFDGDAASDVLLQNQTTGATKIMFLNSNQGENPGTVDSTLSVTSPGSGWKAISSGDFNGDGKSDILWQNSSTKAIKVYEMNGNAVINAPATQAAPNLTAIGTGDFNGDGMSDILFKNAGGQAVVWYMVGDVHVGSQTLNNNPGGSFSLSGAADVDGNGTSDLIWNDPTTGATTATLLNGASIVSTSVMNPAFSINQPGNGYHILASTGGG